MNMDDVGEPTIAERGEHKLEVAKIQLELSKKDRPMLVVICSFPDLEDTYPVREYLSYPQESDEEPVRKTFMRRFRNWARALELDDDELRAAGIEVIKTGGLTATTSPVVEPFENYQGLSFFALIKVEELDDGREVNRIDKVLTPQK